jgi:dolichol kinase
VQSPVRETERTAGARDDIASHPRLFRAEAARKALHLTATLFPLAYSAGAPRRTLVVVLGLSLGVAVLIETARRRSSAVGMRFDWVFGSMLRAKERSAHGRDGRASITGATWLAVALLVAVTLLERGPAIAAMWCATAGDPAAALVGVWRSGRRPTAVRSRKTVAGSLACAAVSFVGAWLLAGFAWPAALALAAVATLAERFSAPLDDNLAIAASVGLAAQLL